MAFIPKEITRANVLAAIRKINVEKIDLIPSTRWDVIIDGNKYPPKEVMRHAHQELNGEYLWEKSGGHPTNSFLEAMGFEIMKKTQMKNDILELLEKYKKHLKSTRLVNEIYKWKLIDKHIGKPDINAIDFTKEIANMSFHNILFMMSASVLNHIARERPEELRSAFKELFSIDSKDLSSRVKNFSDETFRIYRDMLPENKHGHHQDERAIATYLTYYDPDTYTFYKDSYYKKYCNFIGIKPRKKWSKYSHYFNLIEDLIENYFVGDKELIAIKDDILSEESFKDKNLILLAQNFLYESFHLHFGESKKYWRIGTSDGKNNFMNTMIENEFVSIGWPEIGDLASLENSKKDDIIQLLKKAGYYHNSKRTASRKAGEILKFYNDLDIGDVVLAQDGKKVLSIGVVSGDYGYDAGFEFSHYKPIEWKVTDLKTLFNDKGLNTTVYGIEDMKTINQVDHILKTGSNNGIHNQYPLNQILYGPPGTGKTYHTVNKALEICSPESKKLGRKELKAIFDKLVKDRQIVFTTFHQSMTYEDFVEGIKPQEPKKEGDNISYEIDPGIFKRICTDARQEAGISNFASVYDEFVEKWSEEEQLVLNTPKRKKPFNVEFNSKQNCVAISHTEAKTRMVITRNMIYDYLIEGKIKDWKSYTPVIGDFIRDNYDLKIGDNERTKKPYVLIIDEINRGNVSQIFGELITLIELDKREGQDEALPIILPYSKDTFCVPDNLYIIGTMNTADRSVEAIDTALRRRFSFIEMQPSSDLIKTVGKLKNSDGKLEDGIDLVKILETINQRVEKLLDKDHMIGHSYFLKVETIKGLKEAFQNEIIPLLQEYFFGDYGKIGLVLGRGFFIDEGVQKNSNKLFAKFEDYDTDTLQDRPVYHMKNVLIMNDEDFKKAIRFLLNIEDE